jgi:carnosine N-methyltransferase
LYTLPHADLKLLECVGYKQKLADVDDAILANAEFLNQIVANPEIFGHDVSFLKGDEESMSDELEQSTEPLSKTG